MKDDTLSDRGEESEKMDGEDLFTSPSAWRREELADAPVRLRSLGQAEPVGWIEGADIGQARAQIHLVPNASRVALYTHSPESDGAREALERGLAQAGSERPCEGCRFAAHDGWALKCRRHAPVVSPRDRNVTLWPVVNPDQWCGDYEPKEDE